ncbi:hypothetical protein ABG768_021297, partial [Culter alburnus]
MERVHSLLCAGEKEEALCGNANIRHRLLPANVSAPSCQGSAFLFQNAAPSVALQW